MYIYNVIYTYIYILCVYIDDVFIYNDHLKPTKTLSSASAPPDSQTKRSAVGSTSPAAWCCGDPPSSR